MSSSTSPAKPNSRSGSSPATPKLRPGFPFRRLAEEEGVLMPDHFRLVRGGARAHLDAVLADLPAGVTEVSLAPALAAEEIRAIDPYAAGRFDDLAVLTDRALRDRLDHAGVIRVGYRAIRTAQRQRR